MPYYEAMRRMFLFIINCMAVALLCGCTLPLPPGPPVPDPCCETIYPSRDLGPACDVPGEKAILEDLLCCARECDIHAMARLGEIYMRGELGVTKSPDRAVLWFSKAADGGLAYAQVQMGHFYRDGYGVTRDSREAIAWYETAARQGDMTAMIALGDLYSRGWYHLPANFAKASEWYCKAIALGSVEAEYRLAWASVQKGRNHCASEKALDVLRQAADIGNPSALVELGELYAEGRLCIKNYEEARVYYLEAFEKGSGEAAFLLGIMYESGQGVKKDHKEAARWLLPLQRKDMAPPNIMWVIYTAMAGECLRSTKRQHFGIRGPLSMESMRLKLN